jgi:hypothetical protein
MFKINPNPTFKHKINIPVPGNTPVAVTFEFKHKGRDELQAYYAGLAEANDRSDGDALAELICGWEGVDVPFSVENLSALVNNYPGAATALFEGYREALLEGRRKN